MPFEQLFLMTPYKYVRNFAEMLYLNHGESKTRIAMMIRRSSQRMALEEKVNVSTG